MAVAATNNIQIRWNESRPEIHADGITLRPVEPGDLETYQRLFQNAVAMERFAGGVRDITKRFQGWVKRWSLHPFSALAIVDDLSKKVIGHVVTGHGDYEGNFENGWSEMALVIDPRFWNCDHKDVERGIGTEGRKGIGTTVVRAMVAYARALKDLARGGVPSDVTEAQRAEVELNFKSRVVTHGNSEGKIDWVYLPFRELRATSRVDNDASYKIFQQVFVRENGGFETPAADPTRRLFAIKL